MSILKYDGSKSELLSTVISLGNNCYSLLSNMMQEINLKKEMENASDQKIIENEAKIAQIKIDNNILIGKIFTDLKDLGRLASSVYGVSLGNNIGKALNLWETQEKVNLKTMADIAADFNATIAIALKAPLISIPLTAFSAFFSTWSNYGETYTGHKLDELTC